MITHRWFVAVCRIAAYTTGMSPKRILSQKQIRITEARIAVLKTLKNSRRPLDIISIIKLLKRYGVNADRTTIFRIINLFSEKGLIHRLEFAEGKFRYEMSNLPHHFHVVCTNCGEIRDLEGCEVETVEKKAAQKLSYVITSHRLDFFGLCPSCQK